MKEVYIVLSQTGTVLSRIIKGFTGAEYCHASISVDEDLTTMYSFGRKNPYNPFYGGYVKESVDFGTFKRFYKTRAVVLAFEVDDETHAEIARRLHEMYAQKKKFKYNYIGLFEASFHKNHTSDNRYYCSEFVHNICAEFGVYERDRLPESVRPIDFYNAFESKIIYRGLLSNYAETNAYGV